MCTWQAAEGCSRAQVSVERRSVGGNELEVARAQVIALHYRFCEFRLCFNSYVHGNEMAVFCGLRVLFGAGYGLDGLNSEIHDFLVVLHRVSYGGAFAKLLYDVSPR